MQYHCVDNGHQIDWVKAIFGDTKDLVTGQSIPRYKKCPVCIKVMGRCVGRVCGNREQQADSRHILRRCIEESGAELKREELTAALLLDLQTVLHQIQGYGMLSAIHEQGL